VEQFGEFGLARALADEPFRGESIGIEPDHRPERKCSVSSVRSRPYPRRYPDPALHTAMAAE